MIYAVITDTRSGSTAFRNGFNKEFCVIGEVLCATGWEDQDTNFFYWINFVKGEMLTLPLKEERIEELLEGWFLYLLNKFVGVRILIDLKYHDFHCMVSTPRPLVRAPNIIDFLIKKSIPIIHLKRKDKLLSSLSGIVASKRGVFHTERDIDDLNGFYIESNLVIDDVRGRLESEYFFNKWLHGYGRKLDLFYEDIFEGSKLNYVVYESLKSFFGFDFSFETANKKVISDISKCVHNYDELIKCCKDLCGYNSSICN